MSKKPARQHIFGKSRLLGSILILYTFLLLLSIILCCIFSYEQRNKELQSQIDGTYSQLSNEYQKITDNFWQLYMPFFESSNSFQTTIQQYITNDTHNTLTPIEQSPLELMLRQMLLRDQNVKWIAIYGNDRVDNYILYRDLPGLKLLTNNFPLYEELRSNSGQMTVYGYSRTYSDPAFQDTFAICGDIPYYIGKGKLLVGYSTASLENICNNAAFHLDSLSFVLTCNDTVIYEHHGSEPIDLCEPIDLSSSGTQQLKDGTMLSVYSDLCGSKTTQLTYYASWWEIFLYCHGNTPLLIILFIFFIAISLIGYAYILRMIGKEVAIIQHGLNQISNNDLCFRIENHFQQDDLSQIADSVNDMAERLNHNINLAYYYEIKQRDAQLSELQSKFNPHFLYNSLEMLRSRCQQNGDSGSAKLITDMATIFRGLISSKNFIPMTEELSFSKRYLSLFSARYADSVEIRYDFDREIVQYGIIRNLFQPLIENYFVHGIDTSNDDNYILLKGESLDEKTMLITVEDNGMGMTLEEIERMNQQLHEPIQISTESYGLKNLHQRLSLFYGSNCGLTIHPNPNAPKGISVQMTALKMTCEEHEAMRKKLSKITPDQNT